MGPACECMSVSGVYTLASVVTVLWLGGVPEDDGYRWCMLCVSVDVPVPNVTQVWEHINLWVCTLSPVRH
jgi:hypothetical protein